MTDAAPKTKVPLYVSDADPILYALIAQANLGRGRGRAHHSASELARKSVLYAIAWVDCRTAKYDAVATAAGMSTDAAGSVILSLERDGIVTVYRRGHGRPCRYLVNRDRLAELAEQIEFDPIPRKWSKLRPSPTRRKRKRQ